MKRVFAISKALLIEVRRDKLYLGIFAFSILFVLLALVLGMSPWGHIEDVMLHLGFGGISLLMLIYGVFLSVNSITRDVQWKTAYIIFSRPVRRWEFLAGKYLGILITILLMTLFLSVTVIVFTGLAGYTGSFKWVSLLIGWRIFVQTAVTCTFGILFATFSSQALSIILAFLIHFICSNTRVLLEIAERSKIEFAKLFIRFLYFLFPDYRYLYIDERVVHFEHLSLKHLVIGTVIGFLYILAIFILASYVFSRREL